MAWLVFAYSLSSQPASSTRVALWRRLQRLGTVALQRRFHVLPDREDCLEAFQWLAQEVQQAKGEATVMRVERFEGISDSQLIEQFQQSARERYERLAGQITALEKGRGTGGKAEKSALIRSALKKLHRKYEEIARLDFFESPRGIQVAARLRNLKQPFSLVQRGVPADLPPVSVGAYRNRRWVTRPRPHVDRLACTWLIRRFIDPKATIRYSNQAEAQEVRFDMRGAEFGHHGSLCTFETMLLRFGLSDPALQAVAEIVHEIDLRDGSYTRPETPGIDMVLKGWLLERLPDSELEAHGVALFEGLYAALSRRFNRSDRVPGDKKV